MGQATVVTTESFDAEVLKAQGKVLVDFWAPWCGPCKMQGTIIEKMMQSGGVSAKIMKCNTDESPEIAQRYMISSIPTLILFKDGQEIDRMVGVQPEASLRIKLQ
jgi:thioredoxin 1